MTIIVAIGAIIIGIAAFAELFAILCAGSDADDDAERYADEMQRRGLWR